MFNPNNSFLGGTGDFGNMGVGFGQPQQGFIQQHYDFGVAPNRTEQTDVLSIEVRKLYLGLTRPQNEQHRRSYNVVVDGDTLTALENEIDSKGVEAFNPLNLGGLMANGGNFIRHSGQPEAAVNIDGGWDAPRFRFTMVVDVFRNGRFHHTEFISGWTDHAGVENAGLISSVRVNPQMIFTVNHVSDARMRQVNSAGQPVPFISRANSVLRNTNYVGIGSSNMYLTRPSDVLRCVDKVALYRGMGEAENFGVGVQGFQDLDSLLTNMPMLSADTNMLLPTFTSRTLKSLYESSLNQFDPMNVDGMGGGQLAGQRVLDTPWQQSTFVHVMNRRLANGIGSTAQFSWSELMMLDPTIDDRTEIFGRSYESGPISIPDGRSVAQLGEAVPIALHATSIVQTTLSLMALAGVATLAYHADNLTTGDTEITIQACDGMDADGMLVNRLEALKLRLKMECLDIVASGDSMYEVDVFADAFNDVFIQLVHNGERRDYVVPAFASSALAPVVTNDLGKLIGMAEAIDNVVDACKQRLAPTAHGQSSGFGAVIQGDGSGRIGGLAGDY